MPILGFTPCRHYAIDYYYATPLLLRAMPLLRHYLHYADAAIFAILLLLLRQMPLPCLR